MLPIFSVNVGEISVGDTGETPDIGFHVVSVFMQICNI